jgi:DNA repair exonuclease SbcCD ATPase subunit
MLQANNDELEDRCEAVKREYAALLESSTAVTKKLERQVQEMRSQLGTQQTRWDELREELDDRDETCAELRVKNSELTKTCAELGSELSDLKQNSATVSKPLEKILPDALTILNYLRGKRKKTPVTLADIEAILEMIEKSCDDTSQGN